MFGELIDLDNDLHFTVLVLLVVALTAGVIGGVLTAWVTGE